MAKKEGGVKQGNEKNIIYAQNRRFPMVFSSSSREGGMVGKDDLAFTRFVENLCLCEMNMPVVGVLAGLSRDLRWVCCKISGSSCVVGMASSESYVFFMIFKARL